MRYQKAKKIIEIFRLLESKDREAVLLGVALLKNEPIVANLNKHYKKSVSGNWPGFQSETPEQFKGITVYNHTFSKKLLDLVFDKDLVRDEFYSMVLTIIIWIFNECSERSQTKILPKYDQNYVNFINFKSYSYNKNYSPAFQQYFYSRKVLPEHATDTNAEKKIAKARRIEKCTKKSRNNKLSIKYSLNDDLWL